MASTLPLNGDGSITINSATPADGLVKLANPASGAGKNLTIQGSDATSGNNNGGNIILTPGAKSGTGSDGKVGVGITTPGAKLEIAGDMRISDGSGNKSIIVALPPTGNPTYDGPNIQAAINALPANGGTVILPRGTYVVNQNASTGYAIALNDGVHLVGSSMYGTQIQVASGTTNIIVISVLNPSTSYATIVIKDLLVDGYSQTGITGINIKSNPNYPAYGPQPALIQNVRVRNCPATGIKVESWFSEIHNCYIQNCTTGIDLTYPNPYATNATTILHTYVWGVTTGIQINGIGNQVIGCNIGGIVAYGINVVSGLGNYIAGNYIESGAQYATGVFIQTQGNTIFGNYFDLLNSGYEVMILSSNIESGNMIWGNYSGHSTINAPINNQLFSNVGIGTLNLQQISK
jgi:hypothetical protein